MHESFTWNCLVNAYTLAEDGAQRTYVNLTRMALSSSGCLFCLVSISRLFYYVVLTQRKSSQFNNFNRIHEDIFLARRCDVTFSGYIPSLLIVMSIILYFMNINESYQELRKQLRTFLCSAVTVVHHLI